MILQLFLLNLFVSCIIAYCGRKRKLGFWGYLFASLLLTPLLGVLLVIVSGPALPPTPTPTPTAGPTPMPTPMPTTGPAPENTPREAA